MRFVDANTDSLLIKLATTVIFKLFPNNRYLCETEIVSGNRKLSGNDISLETSFGVKYRKYNDFDNSKYSGDCGSNS